VVFYFDYIDPGSYLVHRILQRLAVPSERITTVGVELAPPPAPLIDPADPAWAAYTRVVAELAADASLSWPPPPSFCPWTRKAHELGRHAAERDRFDEVHDALFRAYFEDGADIGRVDLLVAIATRIGLDLTETKAVLDVDRHAEAVEKARLTALAEGLGRVPTVKSGAGSLEGPVRIDDLRTLLEESGVWQPGESPEL
jgi:predicted DsbA family dithiol-disulfide isomerase